MNDLPPRKKLAGLPSAEQIRLAIELYLCVAYPEGTPAQIAKLVPPPGFDPARWLGGDGVERDVQADRPTTVRSFALRLGNSVYPHMKLRLSRPPRDELYLFMVDAHDEILKAPPESADYRALEQLKRHNAAIVAAVTAAWNEAGLPTEHGYLRKRIGKARRRR